MASAHDEITEILHAWRAGVVGAEDRLFAAVYDELRRRAGRQLRRERTGHTLQPTALVNEAYARIARGAAVEWRDRAHFLSVASRTMRRVLVDHARARLAAKRPDSGLRVTLAGLEATGEREVDILDLDAALSELEEMEPRLSEIAVLRYMGGLSLEEVARVMELSVTTIKRDWQLAKAWLYQRLTS